MRSNFLSFLKGIGIIILLSVTVNVFAQNIRINEFMALNNSVFADDDGEYSDWMEIYNSGQAAVNMQGYALTDEKGNNSKWLFPYFSLKAGEFLIVYASGKDRSEPGKELHTNFKLSGSGEYLALFDNSGNILTEFDPEFTVQKSDFSYGFYNDAYVQFSVPTPGKDNKLSGSIIVPVPVFSRQRGFYESPFALNISSSVSNAEIYYTLDGSVPGKSNGIKYNSSIWISTTSIVRAVVVVDGNSSEILTNTYIYTNDVVNQKNNPAGYPEMWGPYSRIPGNAIADYEMDPEIIVDANMANMVKKSLKDIPTISLVSNKDNFFSHSKDPDEGGIYIYTGSPAGDPIGRGWERPVSFESFDPNSSASLQVNCGIRLQGGHGRLAEKLPKHSFLLVFKDEYGPSKLDYSFFGEEGLKNYDKLILRGGFGNSWGHHSSDERKRAQYQRDIWTKDTQRAMGHPSSKSIYAHLYINGLYWGIYAPSERMDADFGVGYLGGNEEDYDVIKDLTEVADGNDIAWKKLLAMANAGLENNESYQRIQGNNPDGAPNPNIESMVDGVNLADYMLINFYGSNSDWDHHNWATMRNRVKPGKGFKFLCWDGEHMIKEVNSSNINENNDNCPSRIFQQLMKNEDYKRLFADRVQKHCFNGGALTPEAGAARWWVRRNQVESSIVAESARWGDYRRDVHPYQTVGPFDLYNYFDHYLPQQEYMLNTYFPKRTSVFVKQLRDAGMFPNVDAPNILVNNKTPHEAIVKPGDQLTMTAAKGTIYYTTNGKDPVLWQTASGGGIKTLLDANADKQVFIPKSDIGNSWYNNINFDDSNWKLCSGAPGGVGYEKNSGYENLISLNVLSEMSSGGSNQSTSSYIRIPFQLESEDLTEMASLILNMTYDDGFVAYLNGKKVAEANVSGTISWNSVAQGNHEANSSESFDISNFKNLLVKGKNVLAIHGLNQDATSSDFIMNASLITTDVPAEGGVSEHAIVYSSAVSIDQSAHIIARTFYNGEWSAASDQFLIVPNNYNDLKITEIHYNPLNEDSIESDKFEFIELKNTGTSTLSLSGLQFVSGIEYKFSVDSQLGPNEFIVLASSNLNFYSRYNFAAFDEYKGKLDNNGEWLVLVTNTGDTISAFRYNDAGEWPALADGEGYSLVSKVYNPENEQLDPADWRSSSKIGGSPGEDDVYVEDVSVSQVHSAKFLLNNYPNPFNDITYIDYQIPEDAFVMLSIYNMTGQKIATLVNEDQHEGLYQVEWTGNDQRSNKVSNGIYFYRLSVQSSSKVYTDTKKMMLMR